METISVLNLNCHFLKEDRRRELDTLVRVISRLPKEKVSEKMREYERAETYPRYYRHAALLHGEEMKTA